MDLELIQYLLSLKKKIIKTLRWPIDKIEQFLDYAISKIIGFIAELMLA